MGDVCLGAQLEHHIEGLPTLESSRMRLFRIMEDDRAGMDEIERAVSGDPAMAAKVVKLANSPFYRHGGQHAGIHQAIRIIGFDMVKCLALSLAVMDTFRPQTELMRMLWAHSHTVAVTSAVLATTKAEMETLFTGGLLHDIGRMVFVWRAYDTYRALYDAQNDWPDPVLEKERIGFHHGEVGSLLARRWHFPDRVVGIVAHHHHPTDRFSAIVGLADLVVCREGRGLDVGDEELALYAARHIGTGHKELVNALRDGYRTNSAIMEFLC